LATKINEHTMGVITIMFCQMIPSHLHTVIPAKCKFSVRKLYENMRGN